MSRRKKNTTGIPDFEIDSLARVLLPAIQTYYETEEGQKEFAAWQAERQQRQLNIKLDNEKEAC
ncbi:MAG: hypothetical protein K2N53_00290 [Clostridia bacterium]|nr:hypothetical protein [Clostridia bacterium]